MLNPTIDRIMSKKNRNHSLTLQASDLPPAVRVFWDTAPDQFRIESCEVAEKMVYNQLSHLTLQYLMLPENETALIADAFEKVMNAYHA